MCRAVSVQPVCPPKYLHESTSNPHQLKENGQTKASALRSNITSSWEMVRTHSRTTRLSLSQPVGNLLPILTLPHEPHQEPNPRCDCPNDSWQAVSRTPRTRLERSAAFFLSHTGWHPWTLEFVGDCSLEGNAEFFWFLHGLWVPSPPPRKEDEMKSVAERHSSDNDLEGWRYLQQLRAWLLSCAEWWNNNLLGCWVEWEDLPLASLPRETTQIFSVLLVAVFLKKWVVRHCAVILFFCWPVWGRLHEIHTGYHWYHHGHEQSVLLTSIDRKMTGGRKGRGRAKGKRTGKEERLAAASLEVRNG